MTGPLDSREALRSIVERIGPDTLVDGVVDSFADREEFQPLRPPRAELREWVRFNLELVGRWFYGQPPTEPELERFRELARIAAADGTPQDTIPANYRLGFRFAWDTLLAAATDEERRPVLEVATLLFEFVDRVSSVVAEAHDDALQSGGSSLEERGAQALIGRLIRDEDLFAADYQLAERVGLDLAGPFLPFVLSAPGRSADQHVAAARTLRARRCLAAARGRRVNGLAAVPIQWRDLGLGAEAVFAGAKVTPRSEVGGALDELRVAVEVAVARGVSGPIDVDDYLLEVLLHRSPRIARRLHARVYARLVAEDAALGETLDSLVENDFDRSRTAAALPVHRNTVAKRIERIRALTGLPLDQPRGWALAWLAWLSSPERTPSNARTAPLTVEDLDPGPPRGDESSPNGAAVRRHDVRRPGPNSRAMARDHP